MSKQDLINLHILNSKNDKFNIRFFCDLYDTTKEVVESTIKAMQRERKIYRAHIEDNIIVVEK